MAVEPNAIRTPAWLWPNLLSLDAPLIAVLWQILFARCFHISLRTPAVALLAITVWLIYSADRALDAWRGDAHSPRHLFYRQHWRRVAPVWVGLMILAGWLAVEWLPPALFVRGMILLGLVGVYFVIVHTCRPARLGPKEIAVGAVFALGVTVTAWAKIQTGADAAAIALFALLCCVNCSAIEIWESANSRKHAGLRHATFLVVMIAGTLLSLYQPLLGAAEAASAASLFFLCRKQQNFSANALRVLADAALLSPLLFLPVASMFL